MITYSIAKDFSPYPAGRYRTDGEFSGERFREDVLIPMAQAGKPVLIDFGGLAGCPPGFLEEAFGGLIRWGMPLHEFWGVFHPLDLDAGYLRDIMTYVNEAAEYMAQQQKSY